MCAHSISGGARTHESYSLFVRAWLIAYKGSRESSDFSITGIADQDLSGKIVICSFCPTFSPALNLMVTYLQQNTATLFRIQQKLHEQPSEEKHGSYIV
jgi:hypothetical protein